jgi:GNAT superfamily N-acetyltransferase
VNEVSDEREPIQIAIRRAEPADCEAVIAMVPELHAFGPPEWRDLRQMEAVDVRVVGDVLRGRSPGASILVAESAGGERVGFVHVHEEEDYYAGPCAHIGDVVVAPDWQGRGVGKALLSAAEQWAREAGYGLVTLNVFLNNEQARAVYQRAGYNAETVRYVKFLGSSGKLPNE